MKVRDLLGKDQSSRLEVKERPDVGVYVKVGFPVYDCTIYVKIQTVPSMSRYSFIEYIWQGTECPVYVKEQTVPPMSRYRLYRLNKGTVL